MSDLLNCQIADALEKCDWAGVSIGDKLIVLSAIEALRKVRPAPADLKAGDRKHYKLIRKSLENKGLLPAATDTGLVTKGFLYQTLTEKNGWVSVYSLTDPSEGGLPYRSIEAVVTRSQAEELLAAKDVIIRSHLTTIATLNAEKEAFAEEIKEAAYEAWPEADDVGSDAPDIIRQLGRERAEFLAEVEELKNKLYRVEADNAAKDARNMELEHKLSVRRLKCADYRDEIEALEAKLAAAHALVERAQELVSETYAGWHQDARAVRRGKP